MRAIAATERGPISVLQAVTLPRPPSPQAHDLLVRVRATSVNPVDTKIRNGTYDDYQLPGDPLAYYKQAPALPQVLGYDGAGIIEEVGPDAAKLGWKEGDEVFYSGSPNRPGSDAELQVVDARSVAAKPKTLDWIEAAVLPLTWITAWEALLERMEIKEGEQAGILIVNGAGGVGSMASQIARHVLKLPVVVTTASRPETQRFSRSMGATHIVNHHEDLPSQIAALNLPVPIKYVFITHRTEQYIGPAASVCAPFGKVCSIVQTKELPMYATEWMAKGLTFVWELLGTKPWYGVDLDSHGKILDSLRYLVDEGIVKSHLTQRLPLTAEGVRKGHSLLEEGKVIGKVGLGVDEGGLKVGEAFS
ncbi:Alcohol dehydrogenase superfamily zinc-containing [Macrophomina phaseolina MS6]|uniref:Alcohol dehydrogenase superfamily zinc-containing n=1 Tax=Macrophomina phaseolina (strain MS6) TaxID=1126212 RepID=K2S251_MACPH|nr:Alcohol dehydrogenase superfamily zinc-containing [Macrophomina phaseolina MS6]